MADVQRFCAYKTMELRQEVLTYIPRGERDGYIRTIMQGHRQEYRLHAAAAAPARELPLPQRRLHEGMKTSKAPSATPFFSEHRGGHRATADGMLQKQRKAERRALQDVTKVAQADRAGRKLPW
jgi:hypothetical protein